MKRVVLFAMVLMLGVISVVPEVASYGYAGAEIRD